MVVIPRSPAATRWFILVVAFALALSSSPNRAAVRSPQQSPPEIVAAGTATLTGRVVATDDGAPIRRARVVLHGMTPPVPPQGSTAARSEAVATLVVSSTTVVQGRSVTASTVGTVRAQRETETDASGGFVFRNLPAGSYFVLIMEVAGFVPPRSGEGIQIGDGAIVTTVLRLERSGVIAGRVLDSEGEPVVRASVRAVKWESMGGFRRLSQLANTSTNDLGEFRLFGLRQGEYYVGATPGYQSSRGTAGPANGHVLTYYPSELSLPGASPVTVRAGAETGAVDVHMLTAPLARIVGKITAAGGQPLPPTERANPILISRDDGQGAHAPLELRPDGTFVLTGVGPGDYYLVASTSPYNPGGPMTPAATRPGAITTVSVNGEDVAVNLELNDGATVAGRVRLEDARDDQAELPATTTRWSRGLQSARVSIKQLLAGPMAMVASFSVRPPPVAEDGSFLLSGLRGRILFNADGPGTLKAVLLGGRDITGTPLELTGVEQLDGLEVVLTTEVGTLEGLVVDGSGKAQPRSWVVVLPDDAARLFEGSPFVRVVRTFAPPADGSAVRVESAIPPAAFGTRTPGSYSLRLIPGRYRIAAFDATDGMALQPDIDTLRALASQATAITIRAGTAESVQLRLTPAATGRTPAP